MQTIVSCYKFKNNDTVKEFVKYYNAHTQIHNFFVQGRRIRYIRDAFALGTFKRIMALPMN